MEEIKDLLRAQIIAITRLLEREQEVQKQMMAMVHDHEKRIRIIERLIGFGVGAVGVATYLIKILKP